LVTEGEELSFLNQLRGFTFGKDHPENSRWVEHPKKTNEARPDKTRRGTTLFMISAVLGFKTCHPFAM